MGEELEDEKEWADGQLDRVRFYPLEDHTAVDFLDPTHVLRACHVIPRFSLGQVQGREPEYSPLTKAHDDWVEYVVNRFVDRDMLMRYHWGLGIGHRYSHEDAPDAVGAKSSESGEDDADAELSDGLGQGMSSEDDSDGSQYTLQDREDELVGGEELDGSGDEDEEIPEPDEEGSGFRSRLPFLIPPFRPSLGKSHPFAISALALKHLRFPPRRKPPPSPMLPAKTSPAANSSIRLVFVHSRVKTVLPTHPCHSLFPCYPPLLGNPPLPDQWTQNSATLSFRPEARHSALCSPVHITRAPQPHPQGAPDIYPQDLHLSQHNPDASLNTTPNPYPTVSMPDKARKCDFCPNTPITEAVFPAAPAVGVIRTPSMSLLPSSARGVHTTSVVPSQNLLRPLRLHVVEHATADGRPVAAVENRRDASSSRSPLQNPPPSHSGSTTCATQGYVKTAPVPPLRNTTPNSYLVAQATCHPQDPISLVKQAAARFRDGDAGPCVLTTYLFYMAIPSRNFLSPGSLRGPYSRAQTPESSDFPSSTSTSRSSMKLRFKAWFRRHTNAPVAGRFTQMLLKRLPGILGDISNPAGVILGIAQAVIEIKEVVKDNMDSVELRIQSTAAQLLIIKKALDRWPDSGEQVPGMQKFQRSLKEELQKLSQLQSGSLIRKIADHEYERDQIAEIFEKINEARMLFELETEIRVYDMVYAINEKLERSLRTNLEVSDAADYKYVGEDQRGLYRVPCTPGTRIRILDRITKWANSSGRQNVFWLFGPAGSGKSTIAYTIARRFEMTAGADDTITLGGNFFCSRQVTQARQESQIVRTIVYHLALKCKPFADALNRSGKFETISQSSRAQLQGLLIGPWKACRSSSAEGANLDGNFLILIDAVDELVDNGGPRFLRHLLAAINEHDLPGLKFFVTSRSNPDLEIQVKQFKRKELYRLQDVGKVEVEADIKTYLETSFPHFKGRQEMEKLVIFAGDLFICAATLVRYLAREDSKFRFTEEEQSKILRNLSDGQATGSLDALYSTILAEALPSEEVRGETRSTRIALLHTFLCLSEPTTPDAVSTLFSAGSIPHALRSSLHAVLYLDARNNVLSYHKSFSDFIFSKRRCPPEFWCDNAGHHRVLAEACLRTLLETPSGLRFNIPNIPTSFEMDSTNEALKKNADVNISPGLRYSCRNWSYHLALACPTSPEPLYETVDTFLQLHALFWVEAMNILGCRGRCQEILQEARRRVKSVSSKVALTHGMGLSHATCKDDPDHPLVDHLAEVASFALYFSGSVAASSTPHLYLSALATWRRHSGPFQNWRAHFSGIPQFATNGGDVFPLLQLPVESEVYGVAVSPDGARIATASEDQAVRVWDAKTGEVERVLAGHTGLIRSVAFSSDKKHIVSGSEDRTLRIWDAKTGEEIRVLQGHTLSVYSVAFSGDGRLIASGSADKSVCIWVTETGEERRVLQGHMDEVSSVAFSVDGLRVSSGSADHSVRVWDVQTGAQQLVLHGHTGRVWSVAFSGDGSRIVSGSDDTSLRIWDANVGKEMVVVHGHTGGVNSVAFSEDGVRIVSGSDDTSVRIWDAETGELQRVVQGHTGRVWAVSFLSDGDQIISGSIDTSVRVWDLKTGYSQVSSQGHTRSIRSVAFSRDGSQIVSGSDDRSVRTWDATTGEARKFLQGHTGEINSVAFSGDGERIASASNDCTVWVWDATTGEVQHVLQGHTSAIHSAVFSSDGSQIASASKDKSVRIWDTKTGELQKVLSGHSGTVWAVAFSKDGRRVVSGSADKSVVIWDVKTGEKKIVLVGHTAWVESVAISEDGTRVASGSRDQSVRVWDAETGVQQWVLKVATRIWSIAFSSDGSETISASLDKSVQVWDLKTGEQQRVTKGPGYSDAVRAVTFSRSGRHLVSGGDDRFIRVWDLDPVYTSEMRPGHAESSEGVTGWLLSASDGKSRLMIVLPRVLHHPVLIVHIPLERGRTLFDDLRRCILSGTNTLNWLRYDLVFAFSTAVCFVFMDYSQQYWLNLLHSRRPLGYGLARMLLYDIDNALIRRFYPAQMLLIVRVAHEACWDVKLQLVSTGYHDWEGRLTVNDGHAITFSRHHPIDPAPPKDQLRMAYGSPARASAPHCTTT
ncbi:hypothetical protein NMY22_g14600 [Coprinellus aureogranulatus]|nr:hypothetical protein NMY22_g14600 [Coprinellus aureogranulatus]